MYHTHVTYLPCLHHLQLGSFFSLKGGLFPSLAKKLFTNDAHRPSLQVFPTAVSMVRISVTDSGAGISKVRGVCVCVDVWRLLFVLLGSVSRLVCCLG